MERIKEFIPYFLFPLREKKAFLLFKKEGDTIKDSMNKLIFLLCLYSAVLMLNIFVSAKSGLKKPDLSKV